MAKYCKEQQFIDCIALILMARIKLIRNTIDYPCDNLFSESTLVK